MNRIGGGSFCGEVPRSRNRYDLLQDLVESGAVDTVSSRDWAGLLKLTL